MLPWKVITGSSTFYLLEESTKTGTGKDSIWLDILLWERKNMNPKIEKVREDMRKTENRLRELDEYLKSLRIREKQLCDEELVKVMRNMAGKDGDVMLLLDVFVGQNKPSTEDVASAEWEGQAEERGKENNHE